MKKKILLSLFGVGLFVGSILLTVTINEGNTSSNNSIKLQIEKAHAKQYINSYCIRALNFSCSIDGKHYWFMREISEVMEVAD